MFNTYMFYCTSMYSTKVLLLCSISLLLSTIVSKILRNKIYKFDFNMVTVSNLLNLYSINFIEYLFWWTLCRYSSSPWKKTRWTWHWLNIILFFLQKSTYFSFELGFVAPLIFNIFITRKNEFRPNVLSNSCSFFADLNYI